MITVTVCPRQSVFVLGFVFSSIGHENVELFSLMVIINTLPSTSFVHPPSTVHLSIYCRVETYHFSELNSKILRKLRIEPGVSDYKHFRQKHSKFYSCAIMLRWLRGERKKVFCPNRNSIPFPLTPPPTPDEYLLFEVDFEVN
ncbi:hypothetical protein CEXT_732601 [Caerostris extrusa]|uniref:Uncharacterized protein n=1 Tax=Caerostris extrusa TaxID=172846 RepID=A0AAV4R0R5_CAEEX|nr:hypothetical protein CEXT_732601 [Caerostris extrusa]